MFQHKFIKIQRLFTFSSFHNHKPNTKFIKNVFLFFALEHFSVKSENVKYSHYLLFFANTFP